MFAEVPSFWKEKQTQCLILGPNNQGQWFLNTGRQYKRHIRIRPSSHLYCVVHSNHTGHHWHNFTNTVSQCWMSNSFHLCIYLVLLQMLMSLSSGHTSHVHTRPLSFLSLHNLQGDREKEKRRYLQISVELINTEWMTLAVVITPGCS